MQAPSSASTGGHGGANTTPMAWPHKIRFPVPEPYKPNIWTSYAVEATKHDKGMTESWQRSMDVLLIFVRFWAFYIVEPSLTEWCYI